MSKTKKTPPNRQAILDVLKIEPQATVAQIAVSVGVGRSTAGKMLTQLESEGEVRRAKGGRDGNRRLADQWSLASQQAAAGNNDEAAARKKPAAAGPSTEAPERLKPGQLGPLVLAYLKKNAKNGPHGPTAIAKALERSSGAVGNCLVRLTREEQVREVSEKPRRYTLAA